MTTKQKTLENSADVSGVSGAGAKAPIKRLELRREKVRDLKVRTGVQTGIYVSLPGVSVSIVGSVASGSILPPSDSQVVKE